MSLAFLNGEYLPLADAKVSALDRGFLFGDGVYEVIPFYHGTGFGLNEHLDRLANSLAAVNIPAPYTHAEWCDIFAQLLTAADSNTRSIYLQVTRGAATNRTHAAPSPALTPTVFAYSSPLVPGKSQSGLGAITLPDRRWHDCYIKSINLLPNCLATTKAIEHNADEAILIRDDVVLEGSSSNIFVVKDNIIYTAPATPQILNGITRQFVLSLLAEQNVEVVEQCYPANALTNADEVWLTSSTREIAPIITIDDKPIGNGQPGPLWQLIYQHYRQQLPLED